MLQDSLQLAAVQVYPLGATLTRPVRPTYGGPGWGVADVAYRSVFGFFAGRSWANSQHIAAQLRKRTSILSGKSGFRLQIFKRAWVRTRQIFLTGSHPPDARAGPLGPLPDCRRTAGPQAGGLEKPGSLTDFAATMGTDPSRAASETTRNPAHVVRVTLH